MFTLRENMLIFAKGTRYFKLEPVSFMRFSFMLSFAVGASTMPLLGSQ